MNLSMNADEFEAQSIRILFDIYQIEDSGEAIAVARALEGIADVVHALANAALKHGDELCGVSMKGLVKES